MSYMKTQDGQRLDAMVLQNLPQAGPLDLRNRCPLTTPVGPGWATTSFGTAGAGTAGPVTVNGETSWVTQWTTASTNNTANSGPDIGPNAAAASWPTTPGDLSVGSIEVESDTAGVEVFGTYRFYTGGTLTLQLNGPVTTLRANEPVRLRPPAGIAPAGVNYVRVNVRMNKVAQIGTGKLTVRKPMISRGRQPVPYIDGSQPNARWHGTAGASESYRILAQGTRLVSGYGDSHGQVAHGGGRNLMEWVEKQTGLQTLNNFRGGETLTGIAIRQGGLTQHVTLAGNLIPAAVTPVAVTPSITTTFRDDSAWSFPGSIAGVQGTLTRAQTSGAWSFTRSIAGSDVAVAPGTEFVPFTVADLASVTILQGGNNVPVLADIKRDFTAMVERVKANNGRFVVISAYNNKNEPIGSAGYNTIKAINDWASSTFPGHYIDLRAWLVTSGLSAAGIAATAADDLALTEDRLPDSLMYDDIHLKDVGREVEAMRLMAAVAAKGIVI